MPYGKIDRRKEALLTLDRLKEVLSYNPESGEFRWLVSLSNKGHVGAIAGYYSPDGPVIMHIDTRMFVAHRLAWFYVTGEWPKDRLDHRNMDKHDNRWDNLRAATQQLNMANRGPQKNNARGYKCVYLMKGYYVTEGADAWRAEIMFNKKHHHIGYFRTAEEAVVAYEEKAREFFGEFARSAA